MIAALEVVSSTPRPHFTSGKDSVPGNRRLGGPQGRSGLAEKSRPHRDAIPDRPARSQSLYRLSYRAHKWSSTLLKSKTTYSVLQLTLQQILADCNLANCGFPPTATAVRKINNIIIYLLTAIGLSPGGSGYFTCIQNMKLVTTKFKSGGLHEKHVVATWNVGNHLSICL